MYKNKKIVVVIPAYRAKKQIVNVVKNLPKYIDEIVIVDDACPQETGWHLKESIKSKRLHIIFHKDNQGVGGAMITGYYEALKLNADIVVKIDADGQMDPNQIANLIHPIAQGAFDYTKGNRFFTIESLHGMPLIRIIGNGLLSMLTKLSTGYWQIFDPNNGFTAINQITLKKIPLEKIDKRFFFESDMLFRLSTIRASVRDIDIPAKYGDENSNLNIFRIAPEFMFKHLRNICKRFLYNYVIRDVSVASIQLPLGALMLMVGFYKGFETWYRSSFLGIEATAGTVVLISVLLLSGLQFILSFLAYDIGNVPRK